MDVPEDDRLKVLRQQVQHLFHDYECLQVEHAMLKKSVIPNQNNSVTTVISSNDKDALSSDNKNAEELQFELDELKINYEALVSEKEELEERLKNAEELIPKNKELEDKISKLEAEEKNLRAELEDQKNQYATIKDKYIRHREVFQNNESNFEAEVAKLDTFITNVFQCLKDLPDDIKETPQIKNMLQQYDEQVACAKNAALQA